MYGCIPAIVNTNQIINWPFYNNYKFGVLYHVFYQLDKPCFGAVCPFILQPNH